MSKEQTPITAEEFLLQKHGQFVRRSNTQWYELMEQYAQAKVLEVLEREFSVIYVSAFDIQEINGKHYYETEVKPKYER